MFSWFYRYHLDFMRELALAIIEDDKEKAQKTLAAIDKQIRFDNWFYIAIIALFAIPLLSLFVLYIIHWLFFQS
jgi:hypothetical protein